MSKSPRRGIYIPSSIWDRALIKAGLTPISAIIRRLLELWLEGKIGLD